MRPQRCWQLFAVCGRCDRGRRYCSPECASTRKGDFGRDVIATKNGLGSLRIFDQVNAYAEDRPVPANDVRALLGVLSGFQNVSKGLITATSDFAPGIATDPSIAAFLPHRLELRPRDKLLPWLDELAKKRNP